MGPDVELPERTPHPPRWADSLLRSFLNSAEAETESGDLLEAYRDSILPDRGRWRADFWYVRQVAGYIVRAPSPMNLRNWLLAGLALCVLTIVSSVLLYPDPNPNRDLQGLANVSLGFLFYAYVAVWRTRPKTSEDLLVLQLGTKWGLTIGTVWIVGYISANGYTPFGFLPMFSALALSFICGAHGAIKTGRMRNGLRVGFWSGLVSGLMVFVALMAFGYVLAFVPGLPGAEIPKTPSYTATEYQRLNIFDVLGGSLAHLFVIGGLLGTIDGMVGGCAGILLARTGLSPEEKRTWDLR